MFLALCNCGRLFGNLHPYSQKFTSDFWLNLNFQLEKQKKKHLSLLPSTVETFVSQPPCFAFFSMHCGKRSCTFTAKQLFEFWLSTGVILYLKLILLEIKRSITNRKSQIFNKTADQKCKNHKS